MVLDLEAARQNRTLRILISLLYYVPHRTGLTIHVQSVAEELARRGHDVTVLTSRYRPDLPRDEEMVNGVRVIRLWSPVHLSRGMVMPAYPLAAYLAMRQADIVSIHTPMLETALVSLIARMTGVRVVATHHGDLILPKTRINRFIQGTMFQFYKFMARQAAQLIGYSQDYAEHSYYLKPYLDKTSVIFPPVFMPAPRPENVKALRTKWQDEGGPVIGYPGRFVEEKRPDLAIKALDVITRTYPNARLVFAGEYDIPYEQTLERFTPLVKAVSGQAFVSGFEDPQEMADFYAACDVCILPSDTECFALAQVEAMLCGTPMVMTDIPGGRVPVQVTGMGRLAKQGDAKSIGEAAVEILQHPDNYVKPRDHIESCFSFKETVDGYERIFYQFAREVRHG